MQNNLNCKRPRKIKIGPPPTFFRFLAGGSSVPLSPEWGLVGELLLRCAWSAKRVDGVSLPSGRTTRVGRRKLVHPGSYGDEHRLRLETEQGRSSSVHSGGTARLSVDQNPLSSSRQQNSQPLFVFFGSPVTCTDHSSPGLVAFFYYFSCAYVPSSMKVLNQI